MTVKRATMIQFKFRSYENTRQHFRLIRAESTRTCVRSRVFIHSTFQNGLTSWTKLRKCWDKIARELPISKNESVDGDVTKHLQIMLSLTRAFDSPSDNFELMAGATSLF